MAVKADVSFAAKRGRSSHCTCYACFDIGKVTVVVFPHTYFQCGKNLYTEYKEFWLCDDCRKKLLAALREEAGDAADHG